MGAAVDRMVDDHVIREAAGEFATTADRVALARSLGLRLHEHARFEERVLFQILERRLAADELERMAISMAEAERQARTAAAVATPDRPAWVRDAGRMSP